LQELRLPILQGVAQHFHEIRAELGRLAVRRLLLGEGEPAEHPMSHEGDEEEAERDPAIAVFLPHGLSRHGRLLLVVDAGEERAAQ